MKRPHVPRALLYAAATALCFLAWQAGEMLGYLPCRNLRCIRQITGLWFPPSTRIQEADAGRNGFDSVAAELEIPTAELACFLAQPEMGALSQNPGSYARSTALTIWAEEGWDVKSIKSIQYGALGQTCLALDLNNPRPL
jgi:hypothetical protein